MEEPKTTKGTYAIHDYDDDGSWSRRTREGAAKRTRRHEEEEEE